MATGSSSQESNIQFLPALIHHRALASSETVGGTLGFHFLDDVWNVLTTGDRKRPRGSEAEWVVQYDPPIKFFYLFLYYFNLTSYTVKHLSWI